MQCTGPFFIAISITYFTFIILKKKKKMVEDIILNMTNIAWAL